MSSLDQLRVSAPCNQSWEEMVGDQRVRFCSLCRLNVYNLSEMTRPEAEALIESTEGRLCARMYLRRDGTVITRDCPVGLLAVRRRLAKWSAAAAAIVLAVGQVVGALSAARSDSLRLREFNPFKSLCEKLTSSPPAPPVLMGDIALPLPVVPAGSSSQSDGAG